MVEIAFLGAKCKCQTCTLLEMKQLSPLSIQQTNQSDTDCCVAVLTMTERKHESSERQTLKETQ